ncbi:MAG: hypothetical protein ACRETU_13035, partial [Steroidobacterales bacterium]
RSPQRTPARTENPPLPQNRQSLPRWLQPPHRKAKQAANRIRKIHLWKWGSRASSGAPRSLPPWYFRTPFACEKLY